MAYVGDDPQLVEAAEEAKSGPAADSDKPKAPKEPKAKAAPKEPEPTAEEPKEAPPEPAKPGPKSADKEPAKDDDKPEDEKDPDEDAKVAKGLAAVARAQEKQLAQKREFEARAHRLATQIEERAKSVDVREAQLKERESRISDIEKAVQSAKHGDFDAFFTLAEQHGVTAEAANAWLAKVPSTPEARAQNSQLTAIQQELAALKKEREDEKEAVKRQAAEREQREVQERFLKAGSDEEKYPFLNAVYDQEQIFQIAAKELLAQLAPHGIKLEDLTAYPVDEVMAAYERALESADQKARSNTKLKSLLGVVEAPQQNGIGTHASKPATARTLTNGMTSEKSRTSFVNDDEADAESLRVLEDMKRAQAART